MRPYAPGGWMGRARHLPAAPSWLLRPTGDPVHGAFEDANDPRIDCCSAGAGCLNLGRTVEIPTPIDVIRGHGSGIVGEGNGVDFPPATIEARIAWSRGGHVVRLNTAEVVDHIETGQGRAGPGQI